MLRTSIQACGTATTTLAKPKPSPVMHDDAPVRLRDHLAHQILAGDAEMHRALAELRGDFGGGQIGDLDAVEACDGAAIVAGAARLDEFEAGAGEEAFGVLLQPALRRHGENERG